MVVELKEKHMEKTPQEQVGGMRVPTNTNDKLEASSTIEPMKPDIHHDAEAKDINERAKQLSQRALGLGNKAFHAIFYKNNQSPDLADESRRKVRVIGAGSMTVAAVGLFVRRRQQHSKPVPQNIVGRAKQLIHSR